ncbi:MAG: tetratricopeptide repeat protein [Rhodothermales bacterium]|nr:tetratricopeptide repeat protein [Rhodothermales bacterium]
MRSITLSTCGLLLLCATSSRIAQGQHSEHDLGVIVFPVTCDASVQAAFSRAVTLLHHMTYPQAREAFERIEAAEPTCAMAHWGIAMTLFQPLWPTRPNATALQKGWEAVQHARSLAPPTEREQQFIASAEAFFLEPAGTDYWLRIRRWEKAMEQAYASLPDDPEITAFYALAHLATSTPADIRAHADRAAELLMQVYTSNPGHPGAMHYLVHANDVQGREKELLEITDTYAAIAPRNPHALHMPTHIYTRLGDWDAVIEGNIRAAEAALEHPAGERGEFVWDEFPHAIEYLVYAHLQQGADQAAAEQLKRLHAMPGLEPTFKTAFHLASTQARYALERRQWSEAAGITPRQPEHLDWDRFAWPEAIVWFARGLGAARGGDVVGARAAVERIGALEATTRAAGEELFARHIQTARLAVSAWIEHVEGNTAAAVRLMQEAADLESTTPKHAVTPGPTLPAIELLGDLFMELEQPEEALASYRRSLERYPGRFNSLLSAARSAATLGDAAAARDYYQQLVHVAVEGSKRPALLEAAAYLDKHP